MPQHKMIIDDGSGAVMIAAINAALAALASSSSGTSAPTTTYPLQFWADTGNGVWKQRNAANNAWITLGALDASDGLIGTLNGAKLTANSVALSKLARGAAGKVLLGQGAAADPIYGDPIFSADSLADGSITKKKLAPGVFRQVKAFPKRQQGDFIWQQFMVQLSDNTLLGWGRTGNQRLGVNHTDDVVATPMEPVFNIAPPAGVTVKEFVCTSAAMFAVMGNGWVYSCGTNGYGQLGHGDTTARSILTRIEYFVTNNIVIDQVFASGCRRTHDAMPAFFVTASGTVYACGYNNMGQLGVGDTANRSTPTLISGAISGVTRVVLSGSYNGHVFLLTSGGLVYAAGCNGQGQLGLGDTTNRSSFTLVSNVSGVVQIEATSGWLDSTNWGWSGSSVLRTATGDIYTCGNNSYGALGLGDTTNRTAFTKVATLSNIATVGVSGGCYQYMWAVSAAGRLYTWGYNGQGVIGDGTTTNRTSPFNVGGWSGNTAQDPPFVGKIAKVEAHYTGFGHQHLIILDTDGKLWFAGQDYGFYCGDTAIQRSRFTPFLPFSLANVNEKIIDIQSNGLDASYRLFCLSDDKSLYAIGENSYGVCLGGYASVTNPGTVKSLQRVPL